MNLPITKKKFSLSVLKEMLREQYEEYQYK